MICLRAGGEGGVLGLDEIADLRLGPDDAAGPKPRERTDLRARFDARALDMGEGPDIDAIGLTRWVWNGRRRSLAQNASGSADTDLVLLTNS